ncbi:uncharacterized protein PHALS_00636 [Plasmopara halstedii]|uniref:Uncharacterized protein n=1 Tax=Plasmopara halstedii TaxID=4781 RepID=A0A0P1B7C1_PLAHL|nr:uncharacterized protein PHALS_00636 [Plasmopara halstedii]CEG50494.1 hypothetical protein PHALS_00636 [Plasmopara halstedii]|eukprot:XP_024586863.1 hypothetical protein PHALS_00636 [Plasmopara halstedii]
MESEKAEEANVVPSDGKLAPRYSYLEIKEAQRVCGEKMNAAALKECGSVSAAQQQIFRAHVNDLCATVFAAALRKYNPEDKEEMAPLDKKMAAKLQELETKLKEKEAAVKKLRERVPKMAAANARRELAKARKRHVNVLVAEPELTADINAELTEEEVESLKAAYVKTASSIAVTNAKLSQAMSQTTETIAIVEQAIKRPKTEVDIAMENSPHKAKVLLDEQETSSLQKISPLRTRLALQISASKDV